MKHYLLSIIFLLCLTASVFGQVSSPSRVVYRSALPATCTPATSPMVRLTVAPYSLNNCTATNTWGGVGGFTGGTVTSPLYATDGTSTAPSIARSSVHGTGLSFTSTSVRWSNTGGASSGWIGGDGFAIGSGSGYTWSSTTDPTGTSDLKLLRVGAGVGKLVDASDNPALLTTKVPKIRTYNSAVQSISDSVSTAITFNTNDTNIDTDSMHSTVTNTSRITFNTAGVYSIGAIADFDFNTAGSYRVLEIQINGGTHLTPSLYGSEATNNNQPHLQASGVYYFSAGDYIQAIITQVSGGSININRQQFWAIRQSN
jgi:hypothetical protein